MRIPFIPLFLHVLLLCDRSAAKSYDLESASNEPETRDRVNIDGRARDEKPNRESNSPKIAVNSKTNYSQADDTCPDAAAIAPCVCSVGGGNIRLDCTFVESQDQLAAVFQQEFPVKALYEFTMDNNNAITVFGDILNGVTFESIYLYPGSFALEQVSDDFILDSKTTLTSIFIHNSQITSDNFPFLILSQMEKLNSIEIDTSLLTSIPATAAPSLSFLKLVNSLIDSIEAGTLPIHEWDTELWLDHNRIVTIEPGSFFFSDENSAASSGELTINLYYNSIQSLQAGTFPLRNGDATLYLDHNDIALIEPKAFYLSEETGTASSGALTIDLSYNTIQSLQAGTFPLRTGDVTLQLYINQISSIEPGTFVLPEGTDTASSGKLLIVLTDNQLESLQAGTFPLRNGEVLLFLNFNQIALIEPGTFVLPEGTGATSYEPLVIELDNNKFQSLQAGTFPLRNGAVHLALFNNDISSIEPGTFVLPEATDSLYLILSLRNNQLTTIDEAVFGELMPFIITMEVDGNPLACGCDIAWLVLNNNYMRKVAGTATCADGTWLLDLDPVFFLAFC